MLSKFEPNRSEMYTIVAFWLLKIVFKTIGQSVDAILQDVSM